MNEENIAEIDQQKEDDIPSVDKQEKLKSTSPGQEKINPEEQARLLNKQLKHSSDAKKIKPLKELACIGGLDSLRYILPLNKYSSEFMRKIARNTVVKIILRTLREDEGKPVLGIQQKKKLIEFIIKLDKKYDRLRNMQLHNPETIKQIFDILIQEDINFTARTLAEIISGSDNRVRATAVKLIAGMIEEKETTLLVKLLNDPDSRVRANVIESLEAMGNRNVVGILMKYKRDKDNRVRASTLKALWSLGYRDIEGSLREMLLDKNSRMRASAVWVIGEIGHKQTDLKDLIDIVEDDEEKIVQASIERAEKIIIWREKGYRILVIDNDKKFLQEFIRRLAGDGFHVFAAFDGKDGVSTALKQRPEIILLNLRIPEMNGLEVLKELKAQEATRRIPVVVMCDSNSSVLIKKASEAGVNDYLFKPFTYEQAKEKIKLFT